MADNVPVTPGSGVTISTDELSDSSHAQQIKLLTSGNGETTRIPATVANGLLSDVSRIQGNVTVVQSTAANLKVDASGVAVPVTDNGESLTIDAPAGTPVAVRLSDGSAFIAGLPVSGTVSVEQSTPAAAASAWPVKIGAGGSDIAGITDNGSGVKSLNVSVKASVDPSHVVADKAAFTEGTSKAGVAAGVFNDSIGGDPAEDQAAALRITQKRALHMNLRNASGTEVGTPGNPVRTDPTGSTTQPVSGSVNAQLKDGSGTNFSATNPVPVQITSAGRTRVSKTIALTASQSGQEAWTPASGKRFVITAIELAITGAGTLTVYDGSDASGKHVFKGTQATGNREYTFGGVPWISEANNNVLRWTSGPGLGGDMVVHGYEETIS